MFIKLTPTLLKIEVPNLSMYVCCSYVVLMEKPHVYIKHNYIRKITVKTPRYLCKGAFVMKRLRLECRQLITRTYI